MAVDETVTLKVILDGLLQYWSGHRAIYVPGLNLAYRNDPNVMQTMARFGEVWFFPRPTEDDVPRFGTSAWKPRK